MCIEAARLIKKINQLSITEVERLLEEDKIDYARYLQETPSGDLSKVNPMQMIVGLDIRVANEYPDVPKRHWAYEYILWAHNEGIVFGYPNGYFRPEQKVKRGEFLAVLIRFMKEPLRGRILREHWTEPYYEFALKKAWIQKEEILLVKRNMPILFEEAAGVICKGLGLVYSHSKAFHYLVDQKILAESFLHKEMTRGEMVELFYKISKSTLLRGQR